MSVLLRLVNHLVHGAVFVLEAEEFLETAFVLGTDLVFHGTYQMEGIYSVEAYLGLVFLFTWKVE